MREPTSAWGEGRGHFARWWLETTGSEAQEKRDPLEGDFTQINSMVSKSKSQVII